MLQKLFYSMFYFIFTVFILIWLTATFFLTPITNLALKDFELEVGDDATITFDPVQFALDIREFDLIHKNTTLVKFNHLVVDIAAFPLLSGDIAFHRLYLEGLDANVRLDQQNILLNEVDVIKLFNKTDSKVVAEEDDESAEPQPETKPASPLSIAVKHLQLKKLHIEFAQPSLETTIDVADYTLEKFKFADNKVQLQTSLSSTISLKIDDKTAPLELKSDIQLSTALDLVLGDQMELSLEDTFIETNQTTVVAQGYKVDNNHLRIDIPNSHIQLINQVPTHVAAKIELLQQELSIVPVSGEGKTLSLEQFALSQISISNDQQNPVFTPVVELEQISITSLIAMQSEQPPLFKLLNAQVDQVIASQSLIDINNISIGKINVDATMSRDKQLAPLFLAVSDTSPTNAAPAKTQDAEQTVKDVEEQPKTPAIAIRLGQLAMNAPADITFTDNSVTPVFKTHIAVDKLMLSELNSETPDVKSLFELNAKMDQYTKISAHAELRPFLTKPQYKATLKVDELSLPELSPYVSSALGYNIESGQLDTDVLIKVDGKLLSGNSLTHLKSMELNALEESGEKNNLSGGAISFNAALGMLKDSDDVVELDIPIKGDLDKPSVGVSGIMSLIIKQATMSAAKDYLITSFLPYAKVVKIAMSASDHLLRIRFEPIIYEKNQVDTQPSHSDYIKQLAAVLKDKKDINIKLCPISTPKELSDNGDKQARLELAKNRGAALKSILIEQFGITSKRLYACSAKIDAEKDAEPRVEIEQL